MEKILKPIVKFLAYFKKWTLTAIVVVASIVFVVTGHMTGKEFVDLHTIVLPAFVGANLIDTGAEALKNWLSNKKTKKRRKK